MLKRKNRLPKIFFKHDRVVSSPFYNLKIRRNGELVSRFGFVVSKKIDKRATVRNRIKRKIRSCMEENLDKIVDGYDFLFILKKDIRENVCSNLFSQLGKENLLKE